MASVVSICANALIRIGAKPIVSLTEDSDNALRCASLWPTVRDDVLRSHSWDCATKRVKLSADVQAPAFDWTSAFTLPGDWLKTLQVGTADEPIDWQPEGRKILANVPELPLVYVFRNDAPETYDATLVTALEQQMAAALVYPVTLSATAAQNFVKQGELAERKARNRDAQDAPAQTLGDFPLLASRRGRRW